MIQLDLRGTPCPINFVRTKMKLEQMAAGELLEISLVLAKLHAAKKAMIHDQKNHADLVN